MTIKDASGRVLQFGNLCTNDCATCKLSLCPALPCFPDGVVKGARFDWDGHYFAQSTCGAGMTCLAPQYAKPGRYTATFCATPGTLTNDSLPQCVTSGPAQCTSVEFDYPSSNVVKGTLGSVVDGGTAEGGTAEGGAVELPRSAASRRSG